MPYWVSRAQRRVGVGACAVIAIISLTASAQASTKSEQVPPAPVVTEPLDRPALIGPFVPEGVFLDVTRAGDRLVAVGERGDIMLSDDNGNTWRQVEVPTSVSLTAVQFIDDKIGWAVGHSGIVLHSTDGGETWVRQFDGTQAAALAHDKAQADADANPDSEDAKAYLENANYLVSDGPDKPFLDMYFSDANNGFIVGAYGLFFRTHDGGKTWIPWLSHAANPGARHLTAIAAKGNMIYLAGEQGLFSRSRDGGETFEVLPTPYRGAFFDVQIMPNDDVMVLGLRGSAYLSSDQGATFKQADNPMRTSIVSSMISANGTLYIVNQAGLVLSSTDAGASFKVFDTPQGPPIVALAEAADGSLIAATFHGVQRLPMGQSQKAGE